MLFDLAKQLLGDIQQAVGKTDPSGLHESQLKSLIEAALRKCNVVTREEFDAQAAVLARTRLKVQALEEQLNQLLKEEK